MWETLVPNDLGLRRGREARSELEISIGSSASESHLGGHHRGGKYFRDGRVRRNGAKIPTHAVFYYPPRRRKKFCGVRDARKRSGPNGPDQYICRPSAGRTGLSGHSSLTGGFSGPYNTSFLCIRPLYKRQPILFVL